MRAPTTLLAFLVFAFCCLQAKAQNEIPEEDISISILKWYYDQYPNANTVRWKLEENKGENEYTVFFVFKGKNLETVYNAKGKRLAEYSPVESTPINLTNYLYERFDQFKVKKVTQKKLFPSEKISYVVMVKSKSEGLQEVEVDEKTFNGNQLANN